MTESWPFSGWPTVVAILERMAMIEKPIEKQRLPYEVRLSRGSINGAIPTMKALGLIDHNGHRRFLKLTDMGRDLARAIRRDDRDTIHNIGLEAVSRYPKLDTAVKVLNTHPGIPAVELARIVASEHRKEWPKEKTYAHVGSAMKSILVGLTLVEGARRRNLPVQRPITQMTRLERPEPSVIESTFLPILHELIVGLHRFHIHDTERLLDDAREHDSLEKVLSRLGESVEETPVRIRVDHIKHFVDRAFETKDVIYIKDAGWIADDIAQRYESAS